MPRLHRNVFVETRMQDWTEKATTQAEVRMFILDNLYQVLPRPPFTEDETEQIASRVYDYVWQRSFGGREFATAGQHLS